MGIGLTHFLELKPDTAPTWPEFAADCRTRHRQKEMKMEWIKCSERMPEADVSVLALLNGQPLVLHWFSLTGMWDDGDFLSFIELDEVTHWMPLPEKP